MQKFSEFVKLQESILTQRDIRKGYRDDHSGFEHDHDEDALRRLDDERQEAQHKARVKQGLRSMMCPFCGERKEPGKPCMDNSYCAADYGVDNYWNLPSSAFSGKSKFYNQDL